MRIDITRSCTGAQIVAEAADLSLGGLFAITEAAFEVGDAVALAMSLADGEAPLVCEAEVVRVRAGNDGDVAGVALRFARLDEPRRRRLLGWLERGREPSGPGRPVRLHLPGMTSALRANARRVTDETAMLEAELPWLALHGRMWVELEPGLAHPGTLSWAGVDLTARGTVRLRLAVDLEPGAPVRADTVTTTLAAGPAPQGVGAWAGEGRQGADELARSTRGGGWPSEGPQRSWGKQGQSDRLLPSLLTRSFATPEKREGPPVDDATERLPRLARARGRIQQRRRREPLWPWLLGMGLGLLAFVLIETLK
jgi:uncharacterized protein (TIGR02266 family)